MEVIHSATVSMDMVNVRRTDDLEFIATNNAPDVSQQAKPFLTLVHLYTVTQWRTHRSSHYARYAMPLSEHLCLS